MSRKFSIGGIMNRQLYLDQLIRKQHNGRIKIITGVRRCGKTYLLFNLFHNYLLDSDVSEDHIVRLALDDRSNKELRNPDKLYDYVKNHISNNGMYYVLLDEVQMVPEFEDVLNGFLHIENVDVYVTGSNAKFLSKDIITEFRGRGDQVHMQPLSFAEFVQGRDDSVESAWRAYSMYGGLPGLLTIDNEQDKVSYLKNILEETYMRDILERNNVRNTAELEELLNYLASSIGGLTNPKKLSDTFKSVKNVSMHPDTIKNYIDYFEDTFLISKANRYDIKGRKYIGTPLKYYFSDIGLRNARLGFRQYEETHIMENIVYNELISRGYNVDVGVVENTVRDENGRKIKRQLEVDYVCNLGSGRIYIQSAYSMPTKEKEEQEQLSLVKIPDSFKKVIICKDIPTHYNDNGIKILNLYDFLLDADSLN